MEEAQQKPTTGCVRPQAAAGWPAQEMYGAVEKLILSCSPMRFDSDDVRDSKHQGLLLTARPPVEFPPDSGSYSGSGNPAMGPDDCSESLSPGPEYSSRASLIERSSTQGSPFRGPDSRRRKRAGRLELQRHRAARRPTVRVSYREARSERPGYVSWFAQKVPRLRWPACARPERVKLGPPCPAERPNTGQHR